MVEIFGGRGQDLTYPEMKWWADHMQVSGINFLIPHSFNPRSPYDTRLPAVFLQRRLRASLAPVPRLCQLCQPAEPDAQRRAARLSRGPALYGPDAQVGRFITPDDMTKALQDAQLDCDWLPYDVFEREARSPARICTSTGNGTGCSWSRRSKSSRTRAGEGQGVLRGRRRGPGLWLSAPKSATLGHDSQEMASLRAASGGRVPARG